MNIPPLLRILVADPCPFIREGVAAIVARQPDMQMVGHAKNGHEALSLFAAMSPDLLLMDSVFPDMAGDALLATLLKTFPNACVLIFSHHSEEETIYRMLQTGAKGYYGREAEAAELVAAIQLVAKGQHALTTHVSTTIAQRLRRREITPREQEVLALLVAGNSNQEIAARLFITEGTVKVHVNRLLSKMGVSDRTQAVTAALKRGLVTL